MPIVMNEWNESIGTITWPGGALCGGHVTSRCSLKRNPIRGDTPLGSICITTNHRCNSIGQKQLNRGCQCICIYSEVGFPHLHIRQVGDWGGERGFPLEPFASGSNKLRWRNPIIDFMGGQRATKEKGQRRRRRIQSAAAKSKGGKFK